MIKEECQASVQEGDVICKHNRVLPEGTGCQVRQLNIGLVLCSTQLAVQNMTH